MIDLYCAKKKQMNISFDHLKTSNRYLKRCELKFHIDFEHEVKSTHLRGEIDLLKSFNISSFSTLDIDR